jgi:DNA end-binding protein Ku
LAAIAAINSGHDIGRPVSASTFAAASKALIFFGGFAGAGVCGSWLVPGAGTAAGFAAAAAAVAARTALVLVAFRPAAAAVFFLLVMVVSPWKNGVFGTGRRPSRRPTAAPLPRGRAHLQAISALIFQIDRQTVSRRRDLPCGGAPRSAHWLNWSDPPTGRDLVTTSLFLLGDLPMNDAFPNSADTPASLPLGSAAPAPSGRPSWSGLLQFSLVGIPLQAFAAVRSRDLPAAHLLHADCGQRLRYAKQCPTHGPVEAAAVARGYEYGPGQHVRVGPEELDRLRPARDRALRLERFLVPAQLDPLLHAGRSLYLVPDGPAAEPGYAVLAAALVQRGRWALRRTVLGGHRQVVLVRHTGTALILQVLHYPEQVRACPLAALPRPEAASEELRLAGMLIDAAGGAVDWGVYRDEAARELRALLDAHLRGQPAAASEPARMVLPLLAALQQSVAAQADDGAAPRGKARAPRRRTRRTA